MEQSAKHIAMSYILSDLRKQCESSIKGCVGDHTLIPLMHVIWSQLTSKFKKGERCLTDIVDAYELKENHYGNRAYRVSIDGDYVVVAPFVRDMYSASNVLPFWMTQRIELRGEVKRVEKLFVSMLKFGGACVESQSAYGKAYKCARAILGCDCRPSALDREIRVFYQIDDI